MLLHICISSWKVSTKLKTDVSNHTLSSSTCKVKETSTLKGVKSDLCIFPYKLDPPGVILISGNEIPFFQLF